MSLVSVITEDGSLTCRDPITGELYHNRAGAYLEALKNYVEPSQACELAYTKQEIVVLDQCFGLGYNTLVLIDQMYRCRKEWSVPLRLKVDAVEIDAEILALVPEVIQQQCFDALRNALDIEEKDLSYFGEFVLKGRINSQDLISIRIENVDLRDRLRSKRNEMTPPQKYDLIFHDPFSPSKVPEFWTSDIFRVYREILVSPHGRVLTYSSASAVRGGFVEAGFDVWRTEAVGGKSGGTMATIPIASNPTSDGLKPSTALPLHEDEFQKLATISGVPYRDPSLSESRSEILSKRRNEQLKNAH